MEFELLKSRPGKLGKSKLVIKSYGKSDLCVTEVLKTIYSLSHSKQLHDPSIFGVILSQVQFINEFM